MTNIIDAVSRHAHYLEQYYNGEVNKFAPFLRRVVRGLRLELLQTNTVISEARIKAKLEYVERLVTSEFKEYTDRVTEQIDLFAVSEAGFIAETVSEVANVTFVLPSETQLVAAVKARPFNNRLLKGYLDAFSKDQSALIRGAVSMGFYEGKTTQEIVRGIVGSKSLNFKDGTLNTSRTSVSNMVRTALSHTSSVARNKSYEDNADLIPYYEWVATLDGRTSPVCRSRDGKVFPVGKGPLPPAHINCRSTTAPLFKSDVKKKGSELIKQEQGGTRASIDGQVDADLNYNDWLKKQSKAFQVDVLGVKKTELFRKGNLTMDKFVNDKGQSLTLEQLKAKYPTAWGKT